MANSSSSASLVDLRGQVELQVPVLWLLDVVLHEERRVRAKAELHLARERGSFGEVDKVAQCKSGRDVLMDRERNLVLGLLSLAGFEQDVADADVALDAKGDALLGGLHLHGLAELLEIPADLLELRGGHPRYYLVLLLWDLHVLTLDLHQLQLEVRDPVIVAALELEAHGVRFALSAKLQRVV